MKLRTVALAAAAALLAASVAAYLKEARVRDEVKRLAVARYGADLAGYSQGV